MDMRDPAGLAYAAAALACAAVAVVAWRRRSQNVTVAVALAVVMVGGWWWATGLGVAAAATDETVAAVAILVTPVGASVMVAAFLVLGLCIARPQWVPPRWLLVAVLAEPLANSLLTLTNPWHLLVYRGAGAAQLTGSSDWSFGPVFWADNAYTYVEMAIGLGAVAVGWWKASPAFRSQRRAVFLAALVPLAANAVFLAGGFGTIIDPTPFGFAVTGTLMWFAVFRQDLFSFAPVARALIIDQIGDAVLVIGPHGKILDLNAAATTLIRGMVPGAPQVLVGVDAETVFGPGTRMTDDAGSDLVVELPGGRAEYQVRASPLVDRHHGVLGRVFVARDVTEANNQSRRLTAAHAQMVRQVETIETLRADLVELASRDALTGLHNRRHLVESFAALVATAELTRTPIAVAVLDIDHFKSINDDYGHLVGDAVLVALAGRIQACAPPGALVARWGGEEFFVALPHADADEGLAFADKVRRRCLAEPVVVDAHRIGCTLSAGVAAYPAAGTTMNDVFHGADVALYEAKAAGRNRVRGFNSEPPASLDRATA